MEDLNSYGHLSTCFAGRRKKSCTSCRSSLCTTTNMHCRSMVILWNGDGKLTLVWCFQRCDMIWLCIQHTTVFCQCQMHLLFRYAIYIYIFVFVNMKLYICISLFIYIYIYRSSFSFIFIFICTYIHHMRECPCNPWFDNLATTTTQWLPVSFPCTFFAGIPGIEEWQDPGEWQRNRAAEPHHRSALLVNDPVLARVKLQKGWWTKSSDFFFF